eukprot:1313395-Amphidinium_carterae.1
MADIVDEAPPPRYGTNDALNVLMAEPGALGKAGAGFLGPGVDSDSILRDGPHVLCMASKVHRSRALETIPACAW